MAYSRTRARDADREAAIEVVNAAYADGQINDGERSERTARLRQASTFADLDAQLVDLQRPGDSTWRSPVVARPGLITVKPVNPAARAVMIGVVLVGAVLVFVLPSLLDRDDPSPGVDTPLVTSPEERVIDVRSSAGFIEVVEAMREKFGTTKVTQASLYDGYASVTIVIDPAKRRYAIWMYDGTWDEWDVGTLSEADEAEFIDLATVDPEAIAPAIADVTARVEEPEFVSVIIRQMDWAPGACMEVSASNRFDERESVHLSCAGDSTTRE